MRRNIFTTRSKVPRTSELAPSDRVSWARVYPHSSSHSRRPFLPGQTRCVRACGSFPSGGLYPGYPSGQAGQSEIGACSDVQVSPYSLATGIAESHTQLELSSSS